MDASESPQRNAPAERSESTPVSLMRSLLTVAALALAALAAEWVLRPVLGELAVAPVFVAIALVVAAQQRQSHRLRQERLDSNSFAAKLHLQLMLAETEIERLRQAAMPAPPPGMIDMGAAHNGASRPLAEGPGEPSGSVRAEWGRDST